MAAITTAQAGLASVGTTWTGGVKPGNGDSVTINHAVTVDEATIWGTSPSDQSTLALAINAALTIGDDIQLTVRGNVDQTAADLILGPGSVLEFDASQATTTTTRYKIRLGTVNGNTQKWDITGTAGNRATVRSNAGGGNAWIEDIVTGSGLIEADYCDFIRMGDGTNDFVNPYLLGGRTTFFLHCTFDGCGTIHTTPAMNASATFRVEDCNFSNSAGTYSLWAYGYNELTSGSRKILRNYFDKRVYLQSINDFDVTDNVFNDQFIQIEPNGDIGTWTHNLVRKTTASGTNIYAPTVLDDYLFMDHTDNNPHGYQNASPNSGKTYAFDGVIFEYTGTDASGDMILAASTPGGPWTLSVKRCIVLSVDDGDKQPGSLVSALGNADLTLIVEHNTVHSSEAAASGVVLGETYAGHADMCSSFRSNLMWNRASGSGMKVDAGAAGAATQGMVTEANCDYNAGFNLSAGSEGGGYDLDLLGTLGVEFGANDVDDIDPLFVDDTRNILAWDFALSGVGTRANAMAELAKMNLPTWDTDYNPAALIAYVKAGFSPTAVEYENAAHDGGDIGAVAYTAPAALATPTSLVAGTATPTTLQLSWTDPNNPDVQIRVYYKKAVDSEWIPEGSLPASTTTWTFGESLALVADTSYDIGCSAWDDPTESAIVYVTASTQIAASNRAAHITAFELEVGDAARALFLTAFEMGTTDGARAAHVTAMEMELGDTGARAAHITAFELEAETSLNEICRITAFEFRVRSTNPGTDRKNKNRGLGLGKLGI